MLGNHPRERVHTAAAGFYVRIRFQRELFLCVGWHNERAVPGRSVSLVAFRFLLFWFA